MVLPHEPRVALAESYSDGGTTIWLVTVLSDEIDAFGRRDVNLALDSFTIESLGFLIKVSPPASPSFPFPSTKSNSSGRGTSVDADESKLSLTLEKSQSIVRIRRASNPKPEFLQSTSLESPRS
ncbi:hypothetical protein H0H93_015593 [Arthromyces matolae]|nr:hypothetical protein H0H93_015593 [Arthromyces matolae]